jgi:DNA-binding MurR/RpiR family transcriptional regulator
MILTRLQQLLDQLSPSEKRATSYILIHANTITRQSIQTVAKDSESSAAAILRVCKKTGIKGFSELKILIAGETNQDSMENNEPYIIPNLEQTESEEALITKIVESGCQNIQMLPAVLDADAVRNAANQILQSGKILLLGIGASHLAAEDFLQKLLRIGLFAFCPIDEDLMLLSASQLSQKDTCVLFSYSGETPLIKKCIVEAQKHNAYCIAITRYGLSSISKLAETVLSVPASESRYRQGATLSRIDQLFVVDVLYSSLLMKLKNSKNLISDSFHVIKDAQQ